jgi:AcrR family transcriptional regulator
MVRRTRAGMEETRATLLATARRVFSEHGYAATSMDDLTAQAGLTRGALYHHFGDKKGLLAAVVAQLDAETDQRLQAISDAADDAWEGFVQRCRAYRRWRWNRRSSASCCAMRARCWVAPHRNRSATACIRCST